MLFAIPVERDALDEIHHEVGEPFLGGATVDELRDVRVIEPREDLSFRAKSLRG